MMTEEEIFADVETSSYLFNLYNLINQVRYQRQPFCPLKTLLEHDANSEQVLLSLCVLNQLKTGYTVDYNRFMAEISPKPGHQSSIHRRH